MAARLPQTKPREHSRPHGAGGAGGASPRRPRLSVRRVESTSTLRRRTDFDRIKAALIAAGGGGVIQFAFGDKVLDITNKAAAPGASAVAATSSDGAGKRRGDALKETRFNRISRSLLPQYNELRDDAFERLYICK